MHCLQSVTAVAWQTWSREGAPFISGCLAFPPVQCTIEWFFLQKDCIAVAAEQAPTVSVLLNQPGEPLHSWEECREPPRRAAEVGEREIMSNRNYQLFLNPLSSFQLYVAKSFSL